ncbi:MAG: copper-binding protein [Rhodoferax sp.]|nr:copper-binding protein [Rhodoferax sp.]
MFRPKHVADGTVRKVFLKPADWTIQHSAIRHLGMPAMTTVFPSRIRRCWTRFRSATRSSSLPSGSPGRALRTEVKLAR